MSKFFYSRIKKITERKVSASIDKLAARIVKKTIDKGKHKNTWNTILDEIIENQNSYELNEQKLLIENNSENKDSNTHEFENQKDEEIIDSSIDEITEITKLNKLKVLIENNSDNNHSDENEFENQKDEKIMDSSVDQITENPNLNKLYERKILIESNSDNNHSDTNEFENQKDEETMNSSIDEITENPNLIKLYERKILIESNSDNSHSDTNVLVNQKDEKCVKFSRHTEIQKESIKNRKNNILSNIFENFFLIIASIISFFLYFQLFGDSNTIDNEDPKSYKQKLHNLRLVHKKLLKRFNKNSANNKSKSKLKRAKISTKDCNKLRDSIEAKINGRRIIDFNYMWHELREKLQDHDSKKCLLDDWMLQKEVSFHGGLRSQFVFKCRKCNKECRVWSEGISGNTMDVNQSSVLGTLVEGIGYTQINGVLAGMGIPYITDKTFKSHQETLFCHLEQLSTQSMKDANEEEARLAKEAGDIDENGIPFITVVVDGSWLKRSYGTNYNSLSGLGAIIGQKTGKVLYVGVKNKYCTTCYRAEKLDLIPKKHLCCRNFPYSAASSLMESEALVEGFQKSFDNYRIIYKYYVGDGDSSFQKSLIDANPYAQFNIIPRKMECTNHLLRNFCKKASLVTTITQKKSQRQKGFVTLRNMVKNNILKIRQIVVEEVDKELVSDKTWKQKVESLRRRILNIPSHVFGEHKRCKEFGYTCNDNSESSTKETNYVPYLKAYNFYAKIEDPIRSLSNHSESLLHKVTNNIVESFNNLIGKAVNGKRVNFACSNQYNTRVAIAVLQHNTQEAFIEIYKGMEKEVPNALEAVIRQRKEKVARTRIDRITNGRKRTFFYNSNDKNYGTHCQKPDLPEEQLVLLREDHKIKLLENQEDRVNIELQTRDQGNSDLWISLRKYMLTASNFGPVCRMRAQTSCRNNVKKVLFFNFDTPAMRYGRETEGIARKELAAYLDKEIQINGLFIDPIDPRFGASPDGIIEDDGLVEIKNPFCAKDMTPEEAMKSFPDLNFLNKKTNGMKTTHHWYYQIQGQLHITQRQYCMFAMRTTKGMAILRIERDDNFWNQNMQPQLSTFYDNCLLPEILDSRFLRNMPIRDPPYILEAQRKCQEQSNQVKSAKQSIEQILTIDKDIDQNNSDMKVEEDEKKSSKKRILKTNKRKRVNKITKPTNPESSKIIFTSAFKKEETESDNDVNVLTITEVKRMVKNAIKCSSVITSNSENIDYDSDDVIYGGSYTDPNAFDSKSVDSITTYFETKGIEDDVNNFTNTILHMKKQLPDDVMDIFLSIVKEQTQYEVQSILYQYFLCAVQPVKSTKSIMILGGSSTNHWRFAYYDGALIHVYDTIPNYTGGKLVKQEMNYVNKRYPTVVERDIIFEKITTIQPDGTSCGVYAAAHATHFILTGDPSNVAFSMNVSLMRKHLLKLLKKRELSEFPMER